MPGGRTALGSRIVAIVTVCALNRISTVSGSHLSSNARLLTVGVNGPPFHGKPDVSIA